MKALSNKALAVLEVLKDGDEWTCKALAEHIRKATPCGACDGSGVGDHQDRCRKCWGWGTVPFGYSDAYIALKALMARRLVRRRYIVDEWGDATPKLVYSAVPQGQSADELEALFDAPSFGVSA